MQKHVKDPGLPTQEHEQQSFPISNLYGCFIADQMSSLVPGRHWEPARVQLVKKGPEETERQMGHWDSMVVPSKAAHWKTTKCSVGEHESFISGDLQVCCVWVPLLRSFCFPVKHFMVPAIKEVTRFSPS